MTAYCFKTPRPCPCPKEAIGRRRAILGDRLTVGLQTLTLPVEVRILVPQPPFAAMQLPPSLFELRRTGRVADATLSFSEGCPPKLRRSEGGLVETHYVSPLLARWDSQQGHDAPPCPNALHSAVQRLQIKSGINEGASDRFGIFFGHAAGTNGVVPGRLYLDLQVVDSALSFSAIKQKACVLR
jgi:hypothetical protein